MDSLTLKARAKREGCFRLEFESWQLGRLDQRQLDGSFDISIPFNTLIGWLIGGSVSLKHGVMVGKMTTRGIDDASPMILSLTEIN